ncbi:MAG: helix-turn-helix domain-containing protein [Acidimicrobiia bacterium]|nr:helix-turn-helix domain-containing protein [Acidimicrobiia bacterium]
MAETSPHRPDDEHDRYDRHAGPDRLSDDEFSAAVTAVTAAFGDPTRRDIYLFLREQAPGATAAEVAERFGLHPNVARHHLEKLAAGGYLTVELARHESAGRPSKRYRASEAEVGLTFPPRRDDLLATLLARALEALDPGQATHLADEVGYEYGLALASRMEPARLPGGAGHRSARAAVASIAEALTAHGYAAHAEARGRSLAIVAEHCPFGQAAQRYPHVVCAIDQGMLRGLLAGLYGDTDPRFEERRSRGDGHCVARV